MNRVLGIGRVRMATAQLVKSSALLLMSSKRKQRQNLNLQGRICCTKEGKFMASVRYDSGACKRLMNLTSSSTEGNSDSAAVAKRNPLQKAAPPNLLAAVVLLLTMMMYGRNYAFGKEKEYVILSTPEAAHRYMLEKKQNKLEKQRLIAEQEKLIMLEQQLVSEKRKKLELAWASIGWFFVSLEVIFIIGATVWEFWDNDNRAKLETPCVISVQVGLFVTEPSLIKLLNEIAATADTSNDSGRRYILAETVKALLEHFVCCNAANASVTVKRTTLGATNHLKLLSSQERSKFNTKALNKFNDMTKECINDWGANQLASRCVVVTIIVAAEGKGVPNFPTSTANKKDLRKTLKQLQYICNNAKIHDIRVLQNPRSGDVIMSPEEFHEAYPLLEYFTK